MMSHSESQKESLRKKGISTFERREFIKSLGFFSLALEENPDDLQLLEWKLKCFFELKKHQICLKYIANHAIFSAGIMLIQSKIYLERHDFTKIAEFVLKSQKIHSGTTLDSSLEEMRMISGVYDQYKTSKSKQHFKQAADSLNKLIQKLPFNEHTTQLREDRLQCLINCGELEEANTTFETVKDQSQTSPFLFGLRLRLYYYLRDQPKYTELIQRRHGLFTNNDYLQQIEKKINETEFALEQGNLMLKFKKYSDSIRIFASGIEIDPLNKLANALFYYKLATVYIKLFLKYQTFSNFNKSIELNPCDTVVRREKAQYSTQCSEYIAAILEYEKLLELDPKQSKHYHQKIQQLQQLDKRNGKQNFYQILKILKGAQEHEIKKAYKLLAMKYHPDRNRNKSASETAEASYIFIQITQAYKSLMDAVFRKKYDSSLSTFEPKRQQQDEQQQEDNSYQSDSNHQEEEEPAQQEEEEAAQQEEEEADQEESYRSADKAHQEDQQADEQDEPDANHSARKDQGKDQESESQESQRRSRDKFKKSGNYQREPNLNDSGQGNRFNRPNTFQFNRKFSNFMESPWYNLSYKFQSSYEDFRRKKSSK